MNPATWLSRAAQRWPDMPALLAGDTVVADYRTFAGRVAALARSLEAGHGVGPGDRVALFLGNHVAYLELFYAIWWTGAAAVPVNAKLHPREVEWIVADAQARLLVTDAERAAALDAAGPIVLPSRVSIDDPDYERSCSGSGDSIPRPRDAESLCWLFYTSGTTGRPKGVEIVTRNIEAMALSYLAEVDTYNQSDAVLYAAPMSHGAGFYNFMGVMRGARHCVPASGGFEPAEIEALAASVGELTFFAAPTMVRRMIDHAKRSGWRGDGVRTIVYGGGPMYLADIVEAVDWFGPRFVQIYGQGESPMTITVLDRDTVSDRSHPRWRGRAASVGLPMMSVDLRIGDADGNYLPAGQSGEVMVRGSPVMKGYWRNDAATEETLRDGWLRTGDVGFLDEDGYLTLQDRSKDVVISGGTNIYPREVEERLLEHACVSEVAVIGRPHPDWGEELVAFVVPTKGAEVSAAELDRHCLDALARFKRPKAWFFVDALPKNNYGKILKTELRKLSGMGAA